MYSRISRRKIIKKKAQKGGKTQINALSPYGNVSFERDKDKSVLFFTQKYKNNHHTDIISSRKERRERKDSCPVTLALECRSFARGERRGEQEAGSNPPPPPSGTHPCLRGRKQVIALSVVTDCPPETGGEEGL